MTRTELQTTLIEAESFVNAGRADEAEVLLTEVLSHLDTEAAPPLLHAAPGTPAEQLASHSPSVQQLHARALHLAGTIAWRRGDYTRSLERCSEALAVYESLGDQHEAARTKRSMGTVYVHQSDFAKALELYSEALNVFEDNKSDVDLAGTLCNMGIIYADLSDFPQAFEYYHRALFHAERGGNATFAANIVTNIGGVFQDLADYPKAIEYFERALELYRGLGNRVGISITLCNVGLLYESLKDHDNALANLEQALAIDLELGNEDGSARLYGNIGMVYYSREDYQQALEYFVKSLDANTRLSNKRGCVINLNNIGNVHRERKDFERAEEYYCKALEIAEAIGLKNSRAEWLKNMTSIYVARGFSIVDNNKALQYLIEARDLYQELGVLNKEAAVLKHLAMYAELHQQWQDANHYHKQYYELERSVQSEEALKQASLLDHRRKIEDAERNRQINLARFQEQEKILHNILPAQIAHRMISGEQTIADFYPSVSVFFSDIVGFTKLSQKVSAAELVDLLNDIFSQFDRLAIKHGLEKIKTIGDSYMAVCGVPTPVDDHAQRAALFALDVTELIDDYRSKLKERIDIRIGLHSGSVVAGVIGESKFAYDLWGDAVNTASRMESHGEQGRIHCSEEFALLLGKDEGRFRFEDRGEIEIKGKGMMRTYFLGLR